MAFEYPPRPRLHRRSLLYELAESLLLMVMIYALVDMASVRFYVDGPSMEPTLVSDQRVIVSRVHYFLPEPRRGQIAVFQSPDRPGIDPPLIKRIIGLPGETVTLSGGQFLINGHTLNEPYVTGDCLPSRCPDKEWVLSGSEYFLVGDNRNRSRDSRSFGPIDRSMLVGEAVFRYWPPNDLTFLSGFRFPAEPFG
ncbi:MAG: signal peptidase I [Anaerolineaceae bacterium]|nr:signal peptidase I [Anaerolineaceae bacterium]